MCQSIYIYLILWVTSIVVAPAMEQCVSLPEDNFIQQKSIVYDSSDSVALRRVLSTTVGGIYSCCTGYGTMCQSTGR